ncbi:serine/threonine protein phosphatase 2A 55 kDa regulatory subunit B beta isoform-like isoform X4 [Phoenix dactylifera]|uniref:Serine/threonine-protein phosphatase 2A 55 kDa regulatory subunit B n=1 Tax=Phoenix dactylifera TaxID=42345 RepID=A0A8B8ZQ36_PHODC|nr:serine/threonine protein phosphatase 2A 55 kDa regulatory subunit B beta isoform-like isoform X4 [Phoenix dactylifera]
MDYPATVHPRYFYKTEFQSHELEFDYLKSLEIGEKINKLRFCATPNNSLFILSTNDRTIKLWKVSECKVKRVKEMELSPNVSSENALLSGKSFVAGLNESSIQNGYHLEWIDKKPRSVSPAPEESPNTIFNVGESSVARCRRVYAHAHDYNINSISNNSDGETFISADDFRINLWNMEVSNRCFNIVDLKPLDMEDLIEVITSAEFHPDYCNLLAYSSSRGFIRLVDMRQSALCDQNAKILLDHEARGSRSFFTEIIASISDIKFAKDGRHILSRDYMNLKLWDLHMESSPIAIFKINEYLRPKVLQFLLRGLYGQGNRSLGYLVQLLFVVSVPCSSRNVLVIDNVLYGFSSYLCYIIMMLFSTSLSAALAGMDITSQVDLTAIFSKFSLMMVGKMMELHWKLAETQTGIRGKCRCMQINKLSI